jgi:hypothetical protein
MAIPRMADTLRIDSHKALTDELEQAAGYRSVSQSHIAELC